MTSPSRIEIGCGNAKREGFFGIDVAQGSSADLIHNVESLPLPFPDNSVDYIYSSHSLEHMHEFPFVFRELFRVCKHGATMELWTPYGKSDDGLLFGHHTFFSEASFKHICFEYDRFYLGDAFGFLDWKKTEYNLTLGVKEKLDQMGIPLDFALDHMFNICQEWGVFLQVRKDVPHSQGPQIPERAYSYGRGNFI